MVIFGQQQQEPNEQGGTQQSVAQPVDSGEDVSPTRWVLQPACDTVSASGCIATYICEDGSPAATWFQLAENGDVIDQYTQCPGDPEPAETTPTQTVDIPAEVLNAFKRVALPQSTINVQPPGGETLVNLPTILSTSAERHQIPVRLERVNVDVLLEVWPSRFVWHHGDDTSQETAEPGKAWTEGADVGDLITHTYAKTSEGLDLSVDTTWSAQFRVVGQPNWRPVDGTVTIDGTPVTVAVLDAKPQLVR
ncbi:hypothetical protein ASG88_08620 [Nocardioides sp. Soil777]|nr:hypothetical protein ASG88_08620 [Nocardioides sp. Soil777]